MPYFVREAQSIITVGASEVQLLSANQVMRALKDFVESQQRNANTKQNAKQTTMVSSEQRAKDRRRREEQAFWKKMSLIIPDPHFRVWGVSPFRILHFLLSSLSSSFLLFFYFSDNILGLIAQSKLGSREWA